MPKHSPRLIQSRRITLRSISTSVAVHHVSMALLDSCPLAVDHLRMARLQGFSPRRGSRDFQKPCGFRSLYSFLGFLLHSRFGRPDSQPSVSRKKRKTPRRTFADPCWYRGREHGTSSNPKRLTTFGFPFSLRRKNGLKDAPWFPPHQDRPGRV
jgi:hypothetical protein